MSAFSSRQYVSTPHLHFSPRFLWKSSRPLPVSAVSWRPYPYLSKGGTYEKSRCEKHHLFNQIFSAVVSAHSLTFTLSTK